MTNKTTVEVYLNFVRNEPEDDFSLATVTERLGINPTETNKKGEWAKSVTPEHDEKKIRKHYFTEWIYSTGAIETLESEHVARKVVHTFKDKVNIINDLKRELDLEVRLYMVVHIIDGVNPSYMIEKELMELSLGIGVEMEIDCYTFGFTEELDEVF